METQNGKYLRAASPHCRRRKKRSAPVLILAVTAVCLALTLAGMLLYAAHLNRAAEDFSDLSRLVHDAAPEKTAGGSAGSSGGQTSGQAGPENRDPSAPKTILPEFATLYERNPEFFGWLEIEGTQIDYPVMYTPNEPEKYLRANFQGQYSRSGTPFVDGSCTGESDNILIYAHNMSDKTMFHSLLNYQEKDYWRKHPTITFNTLYERNEYEVLAAFYDRVYYQNEKVFKFYQFIDAENEEDYRYAIEQFRKKSIYDTGVTAQYGDKLITLVTCAYHTDNGRFVVVARQK